jgi:hypothetical protein
MGVASPLVGGPPAEEESFRRESSQAGVTFSVCEALEGAESPLDAAAIGMRERKLVRSTNMTSIDTICDGLCKTLIIFGAPKRIRLI